MLINDHLDVVIPADDIRVRVVTGDRCDTLVIETPHARRGFVFAKCGRFNGSIDYRERGLQGGWDAV